MSRDLRSPRAREVAVLALVFFSLPGVGGAGDAEPSSELPLLTLSEAIERALERGTRAHIARLEAGRAGDQLAASRADFMPQLLATSNAGYSNRINEKLVAGDGRGQVRTYPLSQIGSSGDGWFNLTVDQLIFDLSQWHEIEAKELASEAALVAAGEEREGVAYQVTRRYAAVLRARRDLAAARASKDSADWLDEQARVLFEQGRALESERARTRLHRDEAELAVLAAQTQLDRSMAELAIAMGDPGARAFRCDEASIPVLQRRSVEGVEESALAMAPELRILELRRRMEEAKVRAVRGARLPTLGMRAGYVNYGIKRFDDYQDELFVALDVRIPLFDGFRSSAEVADALKASEVARLRYRERFEEKQARLAELARLLENSDRRLSLASRRLDGAREEARLADLHLRSGRGSLSAAVMARERLSLDAQRAAQAAFDRLELWASLHRELGRLESVATSGER